MKLIYKIIISILLVILIFLGWYSSFLNNQNKKIYSDINEVPENYAALVLGAQVQGKKPSYMLYERVEASVELYNAGKVKKIIMSGDNRAENYNEPQVMINSALELGLEGSVLQPDYAGRSTYESCHRAKHIFGQDKIIIVSQKYHLHRAIFLCEKLGIDAIGYEAENNYGIDLWNLRREVLATMLAIYQINFEPRNVVGGDPIVI